MGNSSFIDITSNIMSIKDVYGFFNYWRKILNKLNHNIIITRSFRCV